MTSAQRRVIACFLLLALALPAGGAQRARPNNVGIVSDAKATGVIFAIVGVVAAIGVGIYFGIRAAHTVKGCVASGPDGFEIQRNGDAQPLRLLGSTQGIHAGDRVRIHGSQKKRVQGVTDKPSFVMDRLDRDYGPCKVAAAPAASH